MRLVGAIADVTRQRVPQVGCQDAWEGSDEALCLDAQLLTLEQITRSSSAELAEPWYAAMRVHWSKIYPTAQKKPDP